MAANQRSKFEHCPTCGERAVPVPIEGGIVYSFPCTAEIVVLHSGTVRTLKACPDIGKAERDKVILTRSEVAK